MTVRRFGWSDESPQDAQRHADERAREALTRVLAGERLPPRDLKEVYGGAQGLPIREEVLARHGDSVVTRNGYGAHCLNTPSVMFVDVDIDTSWPLSPARAFRIWLAMILLSQMLVWALGPSGVWRHLVAFVAAWAVSSLLQRLVRRWAARGARPRDRALAPIHAFARTHPDWRLRLYETPAGWRVLVTHALFDAAGNAAQSALRAMGADPVYATVARQQRCFRARLTAKPWRIGIDAHMRPRPGIWPVRPERLALRKAWVDAYEARRIDFAACRFVAELGSGVEHAAVTPVRALHDELSSALSGRPIA